MGATSSRGALLDDSEVLVQSRVTVEVAMIVDERRVLLELPRHLGMRVHVAIGGRQRMSAVPFAMVVYAIRRS